MKIKTNSQKTPGFRNQMRVGAAIANQLPQLQSTRDVAKALGLSHQMVRRIECQALYKLQTRMLALRHEL